MTATAGSHCAFTLTASLLHKKRAAALRGYYITLFLLLTAIIIKWLSGVSLQEVYDAADWASPYTFIRFYMVYMDSTPASQVLMS